MKKMRNLSTTLTSKKEKLESSISEAHAASK